MDIIENCEKHNQHSSEYVRVCKYCWEETIKKLQHVQEYALALKAKVKAEEQDATGRSSLILKGALVSIDALLKEL